MTRITGDLIRLAVTLEGRGHDCFGDRLLRIAADLSDGLVKHLQQAKVPPEVLAFIGDPSKAIPNKMAKWLALKLRDETQHISDSHKRENVIESLSDDILHIRDFYEGQDGVDLFQYTTIEDAYAAAEEWHQKIIEQMKDEGHPSLYKYPDYNAYDLGDGFKMVQVNPEDPKDELINEGNLMGHCVGGETYVDRTKRRDIQIWSLRDPDGYPHATVELGLPDEDVGYNIEDFYYDVIDDYEDDEEAWAEANRLYSQEMMDQRERYQNPRSVEQVQGKENEPPIEKYRPYLHKWFTRAFENGVAKVSNRDLLAATPSARLLQMVSYDPSNANDYISNIDDDFIPYLGNLIKDPALREALPMRATGRILDKISHMDNGNLSPKIIDEFRERVLNNPEGDQYGYVHGVRPLLKEWSGTKMSADEFAMQLSKHNIPAARLSGMEHILRLNGINPRDDVGSPEWVQLALSILSEETSPVVLSPLVRHMAIFGSDDQGELDPSILKMWPKVLENAASEIDVEKEKGQLEKSRKLSLLQDEISKMLQAKAPHILPQAIRAMSFGPMEYDYNSLGWTMAKVFNDALEVSQKNDSNLFRNMIENASPDLIEHLVGNKGDRGISPGPFYSSQVKEWYEEENDDPIEQTASLATTLDMMGVSDLADKVDRLVTAMLYR